MLQRPQEEEGGGQGSGIHTFCGSLQTARRQHRRGGEEGDGHCPGTKSDVHSACAAPGDQVAGKVLMGRGEAGHTGGEGTVWGRDADDVTMLALQPTLGFCDPSAPGQDPVDRTQEQNLAYCWSQGRDSGGESRHAAAAHRAWAL